VVQVGLQVCQRCSCIDSSVRTQLIPTASTQAAAVLSLCGRQQGLRSWLWQLLKMQWLQPNMQ
jgi:hypothetical protein